jgi:hypothetical protein
MTITWDRLKLPTAFALVTIYTVHLLWYPIYGDYLARFGDQQAAHAIPQWHCWNPVFVVGLAGGWAVLYTVLRRDSDRSRIMALVTSATVVLAIIALELLLIAGCAYIRYSFSRAKA